MPEREAQVKDVVEEVNVVGGKNGSNRNDFRVGKIDLQLPRSTR